MIIPFEDLFAEEPAAEESPVSYSRTRAVAAAGDDPPPDMEEDDKKKQSTRPRPGPGSSEGVVARSSGLASSVQPFLVEKSTKDKPNIFALLIGIDKYDYPNADLWGCVRDSIKVEEYLRSETPGASERLYVTRLRSPFPDAKPEELEVKGPKPKAVREAPPTRQAVIDHFLDVASIATENDVVFIHYSGHGSFEQRPKELDHLSETKNDKGRATTLFLKDSQMIVDDQYIHHLRDKEISWLLNKIAANKPHIVTAMDCCNSSGNTRMAKEKDKKVRVRFTKPADAAAGDDIKSYAFYEENKAIFDSDPKQFQLAPAPHVGLFACRSYELAKEQPFAEGDCGVFTYYLLNTLRATKGNISYRDLASLVRNKTAQRVKNQAPQWYSPDPALGDLTFMGGAAASNQNAFTVTPDDDETKAKIDAGTLHGLIDPQKGPTSLLVFPADKDVKDLEPEEGLKATLTKIGTETSTITFDEGTEFPEDVEFMKAIVTAAPLTKTTMCIEMELEEKILEESEAAQSPDEQVKKLVAAKQALAKAFEGSPAVEVVEKSSQQWEFRIFVYIHEGQEKMRIAVKDDPSARVKIISGFTDRSIKKIVAQMNHIAKWDRTLKLQNENPAIINPSDISIEIVEMVEETDANGKTKQVEKVTSDHGGEYIIKAAPAGTPEDSPLHPELKFRVRLNNKEQVPLYCAMINLNSEFGIFAEMLAPGSYLGKPASYWEDDNKIDPPEVTELTAGVDEDNPTGQFMAYWLPEYMENDKFAAVEDYMKVIVSTAPFSPDHLAMNTLEQADNTRFGGGKGKEAQSALDALLGQSNTRMGRFKSKKKKEPVTDWWTTTLTIRTVRTLPEELEDA